VRGRSVLEPLGRSSSYWLRRFGLFILLCVGVVCLVNVIVLKPTAKIEPISGDQPFLLHEQTEYQAAADALLANSIWNRSKLTANTSGLNHELMKQFPELASVHTVLPLLGHRPIVYIEAAQPSMHLKATNGEYVLDNRGKALLRDSDLPASNNLHLPTVEDQSGLHVQLNHQILTPANISFIQTVVAQLSARQVTISSLILPPAASEVDAHLAGQQYYVKFNLQTNNAREQAGTFLATINYLKKQNQTPGEYIDVRVNGRAYYK
jgi:hypothetical protein